MPSPEREVEEELRFHLEGRVDELVQSGLDRRQAEREAKRLFGDFGAVQAACVALDQQRIRKQERTMSLELLGNDLHLAARSLRAHKGFTALVVLTLALGVGITSAMASIVIALLVRPLPYLDAERLMLVWQNDRFTGTSREASSIPDFLDLRARARFFGQVEGFNDFEANFNRSGMEPEQVAVVQASHGLEDLLGLSPLLGRGFDQQDDEPGGASIVVITDSLWQRAFDRDPGVLGSTVELDDVLYEIVGVLPGPLELPLAGAELWVPLRPSMSDHPRWSHGTTVLARLSPGATVEAAQADATEIAAALEAEYADSNRGRGMFVEPVEQVLRGELTTPVLALFLAVVAVLLIACANVANLMLARGSARRRELAVSAALGAGTWRLARKFLAESLLLTGLAGLLGLGVAWGALRAVVVLAPAEVVRSAELRLDPPTTLFTLGVLVAVALTFALLPTLQTRSFSLQQDLRSGRDASGTAPGRLTFRRALVVAQVALALILLGGAGLLMESMRRVLQVDRGFDVSNVLRVDYRLPASRYPRDFADYPRWTEVNGFNAALLDEVEGLPGVRAAALTSNHPLDAGFTNSFVIVGREEDFSDQGELTVRMVSPGYFATNGVKLVRGRLFDRRDRAESVAVLLVNEATVDRYFPDGNVIGQRIAFWGVEREVVGVVSNERMHGLEQAAPPAMYAALSQAPQRSAATLMVRTETDPETVLPAVRDAVRDLDPEIAVYNISTMEETLSASLGRRRFTSQLLTLFAVAAAGLAALGLYGVLSYLVARRRREIGVRIAIGASRGRVLGRVLREGLVLAVVGIAIGTAGLVPVVPLLESQLFGIEAGDPRPYLLVAVVLLGVATLACGVPALRATRVDPVGALRSE